MSLDKDLKICTLAVDKKFITRVQLTECQKIQKELAGTGTNKLLTNILLEKKYLTKDQLSSLSQIAGLRVGELGDFKLLAKLGQGAMGVVYKARQKRLNRLVALKLLSSQLSRNKEFLERFYREARAVARLNHVNIVQAYDAGKAAHYHYYVMEYVDGKSLDKLIKQRKITPETEALEITIQITRALQHAFKNNIIHRDIKPANILINLEGTAKLSDLGLAKSTSGDDASITQAGWVLGTPNYISPEQAMAKEEVDIRSDIYSLGATLYHMVSGEPPFKGVAAEVIITQCINKAIPSPLEKNPNLSQEICQVIEKMMAKEPGDRYQTPEELLNDLELAQDGRQPSAVMLAAGKSNVRRIASQVRRSIQQRKSQAFRTSKSKAKPVVFIGIAGLIILAAIIVIVVVRPFSIPFIDNTDQGLSDDFRDVQEPLIDSGSDRPLFERELTREEQARQLSKQLEMVISRSEWWKAMDILKELNELRDISLVKKNDQDFSRKLTFSTDEADKVTRRLDILWDDFNQLKDRLNWNEAVETAYQIDKMYQRYGGSFEKYQVKDYAAKQKSMERLLKRLSPEMEVADKIIRADILVWQEELIRANEIYREIINDYSKTQTVEKRGGYLKKNMVMLKAKLKDRGMTVKELFQRLDEFIVQEEWWEAEAIIKRLYQMKDHILVKGREGELKESLNLCREQIRETTRRLDDLWDKFNQQESQENWTKSLEIAQEIWGSYKRYHSSFEKYNIKDYGTRKDALKTVAGRLLKEIEVTEKIVQARDLDRKKELIKAEIAYQDILTNYLMTKLVKKNRPVLEEAFQRIQAYLKKVSKIAFVSKRDNNSEIYIMELDGQDQTRLTYHEGEDAFPAWSPDGQKIAFVSDRDGNYEIYVMDADGGNQTRLTNNLTWDVCPGWSPDGRKIVFVAHREGNWEIYVMDADGKNQIRLTYNQAEDTFPAWSPDGRKIVFVSKRNGNNDIYVMDADGKNQTGLTRNQFDEKLPAWSPDGRQIVFVANKDDKNGIYVMNADGKNQISLTDNLVGAIDPCWSPDGRKIVFVANKNDNYEIYVMDVEQGTQTRLTDNPAWDWVPVWSPAGH